MAARMTRPTKQRKAQKKTCGRKIFRPYGTAIGRHVFSLFGGHPAAGDRASIVYRRSSIPVCFIQINIPAEISPCRTSPQGEGKVGDGRITDAEMRQLMIAASERLAATLALRESDPEKYRSFVTGYNITYCSCWQR